MDDRLYRSTTDRSLAGVCGGLAAWLGLDPSLVRIVWVLLSLISGGIFVLIYIVMAVVVPDAPPGWAPRGRPQFPPPGAAPGWGANPSWGGGAPGGAWSGTSGWPGGTGPAAPGQGPAGTPPGGTPTSWPEDWGRTTSGWSGQHGSDQVGIVVGIVLVVLGAWFLVRDYVPINWDLLWPIAVIGLGAILIAGAVRRGR